MDDAKAYRKTVDQAVKQFPKDVVLLMAAVEAALANDTFKKAAGLAKRLLAIDPINNRLRMLLVNAHLAHSRKQMSRYHYQLAEKEIGLAQQMERDGYATGIIELFRGLLAYASGNPLDGEVWIDQACKLGGYRETYFRVTVEMNRLEMKSKVITPHYKLLKQCAADRPEKEALLNLARMIELQFNEVDSDLLSKPLAQVQHYLKQGADIALSAEEVIGLCELFEQLKAFSLLHLYARKAQERGDDSPLLVYYELYGRSSGSVHKLNDTALDRLEDANKLAEERNDRKTERLIGLFFEQFRFMDAVGEPFMPSEILNFLPRLDREEREEEPVKREINEFSELLNLFDELFKSRKGSNE